MKVENAIQHVLDEYASAVVRYDSFTSAYEGCAFIKEAYDNLWAHVRRVDGDLSHKCIKKEAKRVAARAIRFLTDLIDD